MTVGELIVALQMFDASLPVTVLDDDFGLELPLATDNTVELCEGGAAPAFVAIHVTD